MNSSEGHSESGREVAPRRRQHPAGVIHYFLRYTWVFLRGFWPALAGLAVNDAFWKYAHLGAVCFLVLVGLVALLQHIRFTFQVEPDVLVIRKGVIERERIAIAFNRIQMVHVEQAWWQQILGVAGLRIDTAGSSGAEVEIAAIKLSEAQALKGILGARPAYGHSDEPNEQDTSVGAPSANTVISLSLSRLFKIGLTQNHLRNALIALGSVVAFAEPLEGALAQLVSGVPDYAWWALKLLWVFLIPLLAIGVLMVGILISLIGAVIRYYNLLVRTHDEGLELSGGLLKKFEYQVPIHKVQMLESVSGLLQRAVGFETYKIHQARAQSDANQSGLSMAIPGLEKDHAAELNRLLFPPFGQADLVLRPHKILLVRMIAFRALILVPVVIWGNAVLKVGIGLWSIWLIASAVQQFRRIRLDVNATQVKLHQGWIRQRHMRIELRKLQRVVLVENWVLRRRSLVHIRLHTAAGPVVMRYIAKEHGAALRDAALFEVESRRERWM